MVRAPATAALTVALSGALLAGAPADAQATSFGAALLDGMGKPAMVILGAAVPDFAVRVHHRGQVDFGFSWQLPFFFGARRRHGMHLGVAYYLGDDYTLLRAGYLLRVLPWDPDPFRERKLPLELHVEAGLFAGFRGAFGPRAALRLHVGGPHLGAFVSAGYEHDVVAPADRRSWGAAEIQIGFECSI